MDENIENNTRCLEEVNKMLHLAKLNETDIIGTSQTINFATNLENNYKFLQLDKDLQKQLNEGQRLYIKGDNNENAVLCSERSTYDLTVAETSNSLLLVENLKFYDNLKNTERQFSNVSVLGIFYDCLEVVPSRPRLAKLQEILSKTLYKGPEYEFEQNPENLHTFDSLNNIIQASRKELREALNVLPVVTIDNKIRLLDFEYHFRVLSYMLKLIDENSWSLDEIEYKETLNSLKDLAPEEVISDLFDRYAEESKITDGLPLYQYKEMEICKFFAQVLLHEAGKFNLDDFLQAWRDSVPEGMCPNEEMLYGIAVIDRKSNPNVISAFDECKLPEDIVERFKVLFEVKEKWTVLEVTPYIKRLATEKLDVNALLAKYARTSNVQGVKYYSAKHGK